MKHYGVVSVGGVCWEGGGECRVCVERVVVSEGVCVGRVVVSVGCMCWEGSGE